jgi:hypothetical protein
MTESHQICSQVVYRWIQRHVRCTAAVPAASACLLRTELHLGLMLLGYQAVVCHTLIKPQVKRVNPRAQLAAPGCVPPGT